MFHTTFEDLDDDQPTHADIKTSDEPSTSESETLEQSGPGINDVPTAGEVDKTEENDPSEKPVEDEPKQKEETPPTTEPVTDAEEDISDVLLVSTESFGFTEEELQFVNENTIVMGPCMGTHDIPTQVHMAERSRDGARHIRMWVFGVIGELHFYAKAIQALLTAQENTIITIFINSPGGFVSTGAMISSLIHNCKGVVNTVAVGECASAASMMWSAGKRQVSCITSRFMYHMSIHRDNDNTVAIAERATAFARYVNECLLGVAKDKGHITAEEAIEISAKPKAKWIDHAAMQQRLQGNRS